MVVVFLGVVVCMYLGDRYGFPVRVFAILSWCWGHCGQVSGPGIHTGRRVPGKLRVIGAET